MQLGASCGNVGDDQLHLGGAWCQVGEAGADRDRAGRAGRRELHEAHRVADDVVVVGDEAGLLDVERLGAVDVRDGDRDQLELPVHHHRSSQIDRGVRETLYMPIA
jgi:hypothetical protein